MMSRELPVFLAPDETKALIEGRLTQIKVPIKPEPPDVQAGDRWSHVICSSDRKRNGKWLLQRPDINGDTWTHDGRKRSLGVYRLPNPGDRLWVKEPFWSQNDHCDHDYCPGCDMGPSYVYGQCEVDYLLKPECLSPPKLEHKQTFKAWEGDPVPGYWWLTPPDSWDGTAAQHRECGVWSFVSWRFYTKVPAICMPRWAARHVLVVDRVQPEAYADGVQGMRWMATVSVHVLSNVEVLRGL